MRTSPEVARLRSIPVVPVPIHNGDPPEPVAPLQVAGRDRHVVEQTEARRTLGPCVMTWGTHTTEGRLRLARHNEIGRHEPGASSVASCLVGVPRDRRLPVDDTVAAL